MPPREQMLGGDQALALAATIVMNVFAILNRRRINGHIGGIVVAINVVMAGLPILWLLTLSGGVWGAALTIWSFIALTIAELALTALTRNSKVNDSTW